MKFRNIILIILSAIPSFKGFAQFTPGNIVVCRIGDGVTNLSTSASPVYLDEYTLNGTLVQSISMPQVPSGTNRALTLPASYLSGGMISRSADGQYIVIGGLNAAVGYPSVAGTDATVVQRVMGSVNFNGVINTTTALTDWSRLNAVASVVSINGNQFWGIGAGTSSGTGGIHYATLGASSSIQINSVAPSSGNSLNITNAQLYIAGSGQINKVGTGLPIVSGQTMQSFGLPVGTHTQFFLVDMDLSIPGVDVLYVSDAFNGLRKYSLVGGAWVLNGNIGSGADAYRGLTGKVSGANVTLFATRQGGNSSSFGGGELVTIVDNSGYNGTFSGPPTLLATSVTDKSSFRGVAFVPQQAPSCTQPNPTASNISINSATISWAAVGNAAGYQYALTTSATPPSSGTATANLSYAASGLTQGQTYYFHVRTDCGSFNTSSWSTVSFVPSCVAPAAPVVSNIGYTAEIKWRAVFGATGYEHVVSTSATPPTSGTALADTSFIASGLSSATSYYVHVRSNCGAGGYSPWVTKLFATSCLQPVVVASTLSDVRHFTWNKVNGADSYEYAVTTYKTPPLGGTNIQDTSVNFSNLNTGITYYFHVRTKCTKLSSQSAWTTVPFQTTGLDAYPNPVTNTLTIKLYGIANPNGDVLIADAMGRVVKKIVMAGNSVDVNVKDLAAGIYMIKYNDGTNKYMVKILKN